jgi:cobalt-zinc-cadmium efflux system outer membrane protein
MRIPGCGVGVAVLCIAIAGGPARAQPPLTRLTPAAAIDLALRDNAALRAKRAEVAGARAAEVTAGLRPNPVASYTADNLPVRGGADTSVEHTLGIEQTIETGGKRGHRLSSARSATRMVELELADLQRQVTAQVARAFTDASVADVSLRHAGEDLATLDDVLRLQRLRLERGDISQLELRRLEVQRFGAERNATDAAQAGRTTRATLRALIGEAVAEDFAIESELTFRDVPLDEPRLQATMLRHRADLRAAAASLERARADLALARANAWWDVTPGLFYKRAGRDQFLGIALSVPLRLFDRNQGEIARARAEIDRAMAQAEGALRQARAELTTAVATARAERTKVVALERTYLPQARQARDTVELAYRRGGLSLLDFLDAQRTFREISLEHARTLGAYLNALHDIEAAVGRPLEE